VGTNCTAEAHRRNAIYERKCILHGFVLSLLPERAPEFGFALATSPANDRPLELFSKLWVKDSNAERAGKIQLRPNFTTESTALSFLPPSGEMGARIRSSDWSSTPLGPIDQWPQSLKSIVGFLVRSPLPIVLLWGPDGVMIYNDAYSAFAGGRHPRLLGSKVREGWPEVASTTTS
jgi:hypothetical protein